MKEIVIASNNQGKINDFKVIFPDYHVIGISELIPDFESSPDSCVKCYTMFLPFLLIKIDVF
ncbi:hypothetical protein P7911_05035, partial [Staphylococcus aureus]|nr:hypothetical protein [Staphylococcus aureus]